MQIFKATIKSRKSFFIYSFKKWSLSFLLLSLIAYLVHLFIPNLSQHLMIGSILIMNLIAEFRRDQVNKILVDTDNKKVIVNFIRTFVGEDELSFSFSDMIVSEKKSSWFNKHSICIGKQYGPVFEINTSKDNFSKESISELYHTLQVNLSNHQKK